MFRLGILLALFLFNVFALRALRGTVARWAAPERRSALNRRIRLAVFLLNFPLAFALLPGLNRVLELIPSGMLRTFFYPSSVWLATIFVFFLIAGSAGLAMELARNIARQAQPNPGSPNSPSPHLSGREGPELSRRNFLSGTSGLLIPGLYGVSAYGLFSGLGEIDISQEYSIPIPHLPRSLGGLTVVQLSDLHVGPYIRQKELRHVVELTNQLRPDLVVITGDVLDRDLASLPDAVNGLKDIRATLGTFAVLGNHDYYADRYGRSGRYRGGFRIIEGLRAAGIQTLRNQVVHLGTGPDQLALMGLDWLTSSPSERNFFSYKAAETRLALARLAEEAGPETPRILLAHHPDTFKDSPGIGVGLTLSGHTHGGGQIILAHAAGVPIGIAMMRFKYLSGFYREGECSAYVNRGIGYLGIPLRINCPPRSAGLG